MRSESETSGVTKEAVFILLSFVVKQVDG